MTKLDTNNVLRSPKTTFKKYGTKERTEEKKKNIHTNNIHLQFPCLIFVSLAVD